MRMLVLTLAVMPLTPLPALAGDPYCAIEKSCTIVSDNCQPATGRIEISVQDDGKAQLRLDGQDMGRGTVLGLNNVTALIFTTEDGVQNQMRIQDDGAFNYLISRPDADAPNGKDQILYRGHCVEG